MTKFPCALIVQRKVCYQHVDVRKLSDFIGYYVKEALQYQRFEQIFHPNCIILLGSGSGIIMQLRPEQGLQVVLCMLLAQLLERHKLKTL